MGGLVHVYCSSEVRVSLCITEVNMSACLPLIKAVCHLKTKQPSLLPSMRFVKYDQSNRVTREDDSSVSYASASLVFP